jgi:hypothetical protein
VRPGDPGASRGRRAAIAPLVAALAITAAAVGGLQGREPPALTFERQIAPFPVLDPGGRPYSLPFLGGVDAPRPQLVDIDGDRDHDLFVQAYTDLLWFFENTGTAKAPRYEWRTDRYRDLAIGEWYRFADMDGDGDMDLLTEHPFSHVRLYRNTGSRSTPAFQYVDSLRDADGSALTVDRQNIPAIVDIDCDRSLDLFVGRVDGSLARYEAESPASDRFLLVTEAFEDIRIIGQVDTLPSMRHGANAIAFADFDRDGDQDLFWGDFFERSVLLIENVGATCSTPSFQVEPRPLPYADSVQTSGYNTPVPVDIDFDGDLDFLMGVLGGAYNPVANTADNFYHWERTGPEALALRTRRVLDGIDLGSETAPALGDVDGDGDLDLVLGNKVDPRTGNSGQLFLFLNEGSRTTPRLRLADTLPIRGPFHLAPALGDLDGDGDAELLVGTWNHDVLLFRNEGGRGSPRWVQDTALTIRPTRVSNAVPALSDIDGDGDLDLFIGEATGEINFFRNEGTARSPRFVVASDRLDEIDVGRRSAPSLADVDGDGLVDLVSGREEGGVVVFRNAGTRTAARFVPLEGLGVALPPASTPVLGDVDGDGALDLLAGTVSGGLVFYRGTRGGR